MTCCLTSSSLIKPPRQKVKTWKFAGKFLWKNATTKDKAELGRWTRDQLLDLGPTFVKLGQIVSTRGDLYPIEFISELESLQDNVPPVDHVDIDKDIFRYFEEESFKSASIGQVHRAQLLDGTDVIVKVKRPGIRETMEYDTKNIKDIVAFLEYIGVDTGTGSGYILDEAIENLLGETDYENEIENAINFKKNMKDVKWVRVPKVYKELSTKNTIVMEYVESQKFADITDPDVNKKKICEAIINSYVIQTMEKGFFHADPHPGNIGFAKEGKLVFYDFGLVIPISDELKNGFMELLIHILNKDTKSIVATLVNLKIIIPNTDLDDIEVFFESILGYMETLDAKNFTDDLINDELMLSLAKEKPFILPSSFIYLAKAFTTVEGICLKLDPNFNYFTYLEPILKEQLVETIDMKDMLTRTAEMPTRIKNISTAVLGLEKSRTATKRSIEKTRREIRMGQYSILCAMMADRFADQENVFLFGTFLFGTLWFSLFRKER